MKQPLLIKVPMDDIILPSFKTTTISDGESETSPPKKKFSELIYEVAAMKKKILEQNSCSSSCKILLNSVEKVLQIVDQYRSETRNGMPPFDWKSKKFVSSPYEKLTVKKEKTTAVKKGETGMGGHSLHFQNKEYYCCFCSGQDVVDDSNCPTLRSLIKRSADELNNLVRFLSPLLDNPNMNDYNLPASLNVNEKKICLQFKELDKEIKNLKVVDHQPVVNVLGEFAVAVFNKACEMHVKKGEHNNLHDLEFMECKYMKVTDGGGYYFYMTIEAIEEGNLGVYETEIMCISDDGYCIRRIILSKFVLTNRAPFGTKAMAISHFSCVRSIYESLDGQTCLKLRKPKKILAVVKPKVTKRRRGAIRFLATRNMCNRRLDMYRQRDIASDEISRIMKHHQKTIQDLRQVLCQDPPLLFSPDCNRTTNQDDWSHPDDHDYSWMVRRTEVTPCEGYDYVRLI